MNITDVFQMLQDPRTQGIWEGNQFNQPPVDLPDPNRFSSTPLTSSNLFSDVRTRQPFDPFAPGLILNTSTGPDQPEENPGYNAANFASYQDFLDANNATNRDVAKYGLGMLAGPQVAIGGLKNALGVPPWSQIAKEFAQSWGSDWGLHDPAVGPTNAFSWENPGLQDENRSIASGWGVGPLGVSAADFSGDPAGSGPGTDDNPDVDVDPDFGYEDIDESDADSGDDKVICAELYRQGYLPREIYEADEAYGRTMSCTVAVGYHLWAKPFVRAMKRGGVALWLGQRLGTHWAYEVAWRAGLTVHRPWLGRVLHAVGVPICRMLGRTMLRRAPA